MSDTQGQAAPQPATNAEAQANAQDTTNNNPDTPQSQAPVQAKVEKALLKKLKLKVDGQEYEEELPFDIPDSPEAVEYMRRHMQMSKVANKRMSEYSQLEGEVKAFIDEMRKNPKKALSNPAFGVDLKKLAAEVIEEEIANSQKSPEQLDKEKLEAELKSMKEEREKEKEESKRKEFERLQEQEYERYDSLMTKALEKSDLPKSPYVVKKMADYLLMGLQNNMDITPDDVLPLIREEILEDLKQMFAIMPEEVVESVVGKDVLTRLRKKNVAKAKAGQPPAPVKSSVPDIGNKKQIKEVPKEKLNYRKFFGV